MVQAEVGDTVRVRYTGRSEDGTVFDSSADGEPLRFTLGQERMISGFERAVVGMRPREVKTVTVPADQAYGPRQEELVVEIDRSTIPMGIEPNVGMAIEIGKSKDKMLHVEVIEVTESKIVLDANHPLAGKDLIFEIELVEIESRVTEERI